MPKITFLPLCSPGIEHQKIPGPLGPLCLAVCNYRANDHKSEWVLLISQIPEIIDDWGIIVLIGPSPSLQMEIYIDLLFCNGCANCIDQCTMGVFKMEGDQASVDNEYICVGCFKCQNFCPMSAIQTRIVMRVSWVTPFPVTLQIAG